MEYYHHYSTENMTVVRWSKFETPGGISEYHVMLTCQSKSNLFEDQLLGIHHTFEAMHSVAFQGAAVLFKRYFMSDAANQSETIENYECKNRNYAISLIQQPPLHGGKLAVWVYLATGFQHHREEKENIFTHNGLDHLWMGNLQMQGVDASAQTTEVFNSIGKRLSDFKCSLKDNCIRTWLFVHNVDVNYSDVVTARTHYFNQCDLTDKTHFISSTGIEGRTANSNSFLMADSYAIKGINKHQINFLHAPNYLNPTYEYGVTFERGTRVDYGDRHHVFISGTASIDHLGAVVHPGDIHKQAIRTMINIQALLQDAGSDLQNIAQMIIYLRDVADYKIIDDYFQMHYPDVPRVIVLAPVCRPQWLIEVECIAIARQEMLQFYNF